MTDRNKVSGYTQEFGNRLNWVIDKIGNQRKAGAVAEIKPEMVGKWRDGTTKPPLFPTARLCDAAGVTVDWLLNGSESSADAPVQFDADALAIVVSALDQYLYDRDLLMPPKKKGKAVAALYTLVMRDENEFQELLSDANVDAFLRASNDK